MTDNDIIIWLSWLLKTTTFWHNDVDNILKVFWLICFLNQTKFL